MLNKFWPSLKSGDIVDIIAPSSTVPTEDLNDYYMKVTQMLSSCGLVARIPGSLIDITADPFSANTLEYRKNHLINALNDPTTKAIWAIRGGYGAAKIIPFLEKIPEPKNPKLLLGFSDITALHLFLETNWNWCSLHSAVINQLIVNPELLEELKPIIFGTKKTIHYNQLVPLNYFAKQEAVISSSITGGNLALVQTSIGTNWQINGDNKIIFLEDVGERGYKIDRMLNHLSQVGIFNQVKALIFGEITPELEKDGRNLCIDAVNNFAKQANFPVLSLPIIGHNARLNTPLPLGTNCILRLGRKIELECETGAK